MNDSDVKIMSEYIDFDIQPKKRIVLLKIGHKPGKNKPPAIFKALAKQAKMDFYKTLHKFDSKQKIINP